jgi:hypothetical protein
VEVRWIEHEGKKILYIDYRGAKDGKDAVDLLMKAVEIEKRSEGHLLILQNFEGTFGNDEYMAKVKEVGKEVNDKVFRNALVGITGVKKILLAGYAKISGEKGLKTFDSEQAGKEWLISP